MRCLRFPALGYAGLLALAGAGPATGAPPAGKPSPWNAATQKPAPQPSPLPQDAMDLRLYESPLPYRPGLPRRDDPAWATDVTAVMTTCPDGSRIITALVIGGQHTTLDARCRDERPPAGPAPQCDAKSWNCRTPPSP